MLSKPAAGTPRICRKVHGSPFWTVLKCISCDKEITLEEADRVIAESDKLEQVIRRSMWTDFAMMTDERWRDEDWMDTHPQYWFNPLCFNRVLTFTVICEKCAKEYVRNF